MNSRMQEPIPTPSAEQTSPALHPETESRTPIRRHYALLVGAVVTLPVFLFLKAGQFGKGSAVLAWLILGIAVTSWTKWKNRQHIPLLQIVLSFYPIYFSFSVFMPSEMRLLYSRFTASETILRETMLIVALTQCSIWAGWILTKRFVRLKPLHLNVPDTRLTVYAYSIIAFQIILFIIKQGNPDLDLSGYIQIINGLANMYIALGILFFTGEARGWNILNLLGIAVIVAYHIAISVDNTMLGEAVMPLIVLGVLMIRRHRKTAVALALMLTGIALLIQPVKLSYRLTLMQMQEMGMNTTLADKAELYLHLLNMHWIESRVIPFYEESAQVQFSKRLSLVPIISVILHETPERIPFQYGSTFRYLLFTPVPRVIYKDKPTAQEANIWFARSYGILDEQLAKTTMVGISHVGEVYVNFGWFGIIPIFTLFGAMMYVIMLLTAGGRRQSSIANNAVMTALLPIFFAVESTLTGFLSAILYTFFLSYIILRLFSRRNVPEQPSA